MSTDYSAFMDGKTELMTTSKRKLEMDVWPEKGKAWVDDEDGSIHYSSDRLTEDQFVEIGVAILGPLFYFTDDEDALVLKIKDEFTKRGFTHRFQ